MDTDTRTDEILPCPYCGGMATLTVSSDGYGVQCLNDTCIALHADSLPTEDEAVAAWNRTAYGSRPFRGTEGNGRCPQPNTREVGLTDNLATLQGDGPSFEPLAYECEYELKTQTGPFTVTALKFSGNASPKLMDALVDAVAAIAEGSGVDVAVDEADEDDVAEV